MNPNPEPQKLVLFLMQFYQEEEDTTAFDWTYHRGYIGGLDSCSANKQAIP